MRYLALQLFGRNEAGGMACMVDDLSWSQPLEVVEYLDTDDPSRLTRGIYSYLQKNEYTPDRDGVITVITFGIVRTTLLSGLITLGRYLEFSGGILNPNLLGWAKPETMVPDSIGPRPTEIVRAVRTHFSKSNGKTRRSK